MISVTWLNSSNHVNQSSVTMLCTSLIFFLYCDKFSRSFVYLMLTSHLCQTFSFLTYTVFSFAVILFISVFFWFAYFAFTSILISYWCCINKLRINLSFKDQMMQLLNHIMRVIIIAVNAWAQNFISAIYSFFFSNFLYLRSRAISTFTVQRLSFESFNHIDVSRQMINLVR